MDNENRLTSKQVWKFPLLALFTIRFYFFVLFKMQGFGFLYLLSLAALMSLPATYQVQKSLQYYSRLELPSLVGQLPPSRVDGLFHLVPAAGQPDYKVIYTSSGVATLVYNPGDRPLDAEARGALIELGSSDLILHGDREDTRVPYSAFLVSNSEFEPLNSAIAMDRIFNCSFLILAFIIFLWFYVLLFFNALLAALFGKFLMLFIAGIKIGYENTARLCAYASTLVAVILVLQCYVPLPISMSVLMFVPLIYCILFAREFKRELMQLGVQGFAEKYGFKVADAAARQRTRQQAIDRLTGRSSEYEESQQQQDASQSAKAADNSSDKCENDEQVQKTAEKTTENSAVEIKRGHNKDQRKDDQRGSGFFTP
ncbi:MAG: DUF1189 domain-containing protein [Succinivibrio sp.]|nr:DUF1189 domain-containing protein [Succinivibrio sp.]